MSRYLLAARVNVAGNGSNPGLRLIVTVSPVPLYATFQAETKHVAVATQQSKAVLRVALEAFASEHPDDVTYFPAFETVMWCTENRWAPDMRHVSDEAVANVMALFHHMFERRPAGDLAGFQPRAV